MSIEKKDIALSVKELKKIKIVAVETNSHSRGVKFVKLKALIVRIINK